MGGHLKKYCCWLGERVLGSSRRLQPAVVSVLSHIVIEDADLTL